MIDDINDGYIEPPAVVRSENHDVEYWDKQAIEADKSRSDSSIDHAEALYHLNEDDNYQVLGFDSLGEYCFARFGKSKAWAKKLISIHKKFVVELGKTKQELKKVGFGKLGKLVSVVQEETVDEVLAEAENMSQKEIDEKIKENKGLEVNETEVDEEYTSFRFKMPKESKEVLKLALDSAKKQYAQSQNVETKNVMDFQALEMMSSHYLLSTEDYSDNEEILDKLFHELELKYKITITREKNIET